jgi:predicted nucleic acid-binding protein
MIIFDTSAWIEYFKDSEKAGDIEKFLESEEIFTPSIVLIELSCKSIKEGWDFNKHLRFIKSKSIIIGVKEETIIKCGKIYYENRKKNSSFGMIDAIIWTTAEDFKAKILTKDNHFKDFKEAIII